MFLYDHGESLRHRGAYNMLLFVLFVVPGIVVGGVEYALWRLVGGRKLVALHILIFIGGSLAMRVALHNAVQVWDRGFRGERILTVKS